MFVTSLLSIAYSFNLRGADIPYSPLLQVYFMLSLDRAILFTDLSKATDNVRDYLNNLGIERKEYIEFWSFLRRRKWGEGKVLISPQTSYDISLVPTHFRCTIAPSRIVEMKAIKNETEMEGMRQAHLRDGAAFVKWFAWMDVKLSRGFDITEYDAAWRLAEFRKQNKHCWGLAYEI